MTSIQGSAIKYRVSPPSAAHRLIDIKRRDTPVATDDTPIQTDTQEDAFATMTRYREREMYFVPGDRRTTTE